MRWRAVVAVGLFIGVGPFGVLFVAMNTGLPAGLASVIAPLQPVFTIPFAVIALGERPSSRQLVGVSLAVIGLATIAAGRARGVPLQHGLPGSLEVRTETLTAAALALRTAGRLIAQPTTQYP